MRLKHLRKVNLHPRRAARPARTELTRQTSPPPQSLGPPSHSLAMFSGMVDRPAIIMQEHPAILSCCPPAIFSGVSPPVLSWLNRFAGVVVLLCVQCKRDDPAEPP